MEGILMDFYSALLAKANGGGGGLEFVEIHIDPDTMIADMTWQQAYDTLASGKLIILKYADNIPEEFIATAGITIYTLAELVLDGEIYVYCLSGCSPLPDGTASSSVLRASSPNDYLGF